MEAMKHGRDWEGAAPESDAAAFALVPRLRFFFNIFFYFLFTDLRQTGLIRSESSRIGRIGSYWLAIEMAESS